MAELVPIVESGDLKNVVMQSDLQFLWATDAAYENMQLGIGPNGWVALGRAINNNEITQDTNAASIALSIGVESSAICAVTVPNAIELGSGTYLLSYRYSCAGGPATVTTRVYVNGGLQTTQVSQIDANVSDRVLNFSGNIGTALTASDTVHFTVESSIAGSVDGPNYTSVLRTVNVREIDHQKLLNRDDPNVHSHLQTAGYGGIAKTTDTNYGTVGSGAWTTIDNWDSGMVVTPVGVVQDVANSGLRFDAQGVFSVVGTVAVSFTDTNQGRVFGVRLYNQTKATPGREIQYFVGRNQEGVNLSQSGILAEIGASEVNDLFQLQIAGVGDSFANVAVIDAVYSAVKQSGYFG
ncbi:MAG: hypothetical protein QNJ71_11295 [Acidimicrobiia bacterium]|nr:hypothetical protein [Acidimicrobiia bacterium]